MARLWRRLLVLLTVTRLVEAALCGSNAYGAPYEEGLAYGYRKRWDIVRERLRVLAGLAAGAAFTGHQRSPCSRTRQEERARTSRMGRLRGGAAANCPVASGAACSWPRGGPDPSRAKHRTLTGAFAFRSPSGEGLSRQPPLPLQRPPTWTAI